MLPVAPADSRTPFGPISPGGTFFCSLSQLQPFSLFPFLPSALLSLHLPHLCFQPHKSTSTLNHQSPLTTTFTMASRVFASRLASQMATKAARPAVRANVAAASKRTITGKPELSEKNLFWSQTAQEI